MGSYSNIKKNNFIKEWLQESFIEKKMNSFSGILLLAFLAVLVGLVNAQINYFAGFGFVVFFMAVLVILVFIRFPYFGLYFTFCFSYLVNTLNRLFLFTPLDFIQFNNIYTALVFVLFIAILNKPALQINKESHFFKNPISIAFVLLLGYYLLQGLNPNMSKLGWVSFMQKYFQTLVTFYCLFSLLRTWKQIRYFILFTIGLVTILALYTCKQQWFGLFPFEQRWLFANPKTYLILFQGGFVRKWSLLSDPATAGMLFSGIALQCLILVLRVPEKKLKRLLGLAMVINILAFTYTGTRTATMMFIAGVAFYGLATFYEPRTRRMIAIAGAFIALLIVSPYSPPTISRLKTVFHGTKDPSAAIRDFDRHEIQPYLYHHPMGGGVSTTGYEGLKYNPGHPLINFQPDGGYMWMFAEQGWIGLLLMVIAFFMILYFGVHRFYRISKPELQDYCIAVVVMIFSMAVGQYSQFALNFFPMYLLGAMVLIIRLKTIEIKPNN
jgi:putative inorganic carbon (hco3(-)) transporter